MVFINERYGSSGKKLYELEDLETGQRTTWTPPPDMARAKHREALIQVARRLEATGQQKSFDFSIASAPMQEEADANTTFGTYATKVFIPRRAPKVAEKTLDGWKQYLRLRILPSFGSVAIGAITPGRLIDFFAGMQAEGLSYHTIERYYAFVNVVLKMAEKTGVILSNPMRKVDKPSPRKDELIDDGVEACTAEEIARLLQAMEREPLKWKIVSV